MAKDMSYATLGEHLASVLDRVFDDQEIVIVRRKGAKDVALVPACELAGLLETAHSCAPHGTPRGGLRVSTWSAPGIARAAKG